MADQDSNKINLPLALYSSTPSWWDLHHHATRPTLSTSLRNNTGSSGVNSWEHHSNLSSSPCDHEDVSISVFNHSSLTIDESSHQFVGTPSNYIIREISSTDNNIHVWSQALLGVGGSQELSRDGMGENLLNAHSLKCFSGGMFENSACSEYLRKLGSHHDDKWAEISGDQYPVTSEFFTGNIDKQSINSNAGYNGDSNLIENIDHQRSLNTLSPSNLVRSWSIAPPDQPQLIEHIVSHPCNDIIHSVDHYLQPDITTEQTKQSTVYQPQSFGLGPASIFECENSSLNHQMRQDNDQCGGSEQVYSIPATLFPMASFINPFQSGFRPVGDNWRPREIKMLSQHGFTPSVIDRFSKFSSKTPPNSTSLLDASKQHAGIHANSSMTTKGNGTRQGSLINGAKKKRGDDAFQSSSSLKKPKHVNIAFNPSTASSSVKMTTMRTPKGKVEAEKLLELQKIVFPYGKTDTASILQDAIGFIRHHQETVQTAILSNQYMKSSVNKLQEAWGSLDRIGDRNKVLDLKNKGLCLVPISSIPQEIKEDDSGLDYWPAYRGYLYR